VDGNVRVAAAYDRLGIGIGHAVGQRRSAPAERVDFEHAHRPVPDDRLGVRQGFRKQRDRRRADIQSGPVDIDLLNGNDFRFRLGALVFGDDAIDGQIELHSLFPGRLHDLLRLFEEFILNDRTADLVPEGLEEREGHAAADDHLIDLLDEVAQHLQFAGNLRSPGNRDEGPGRLLQRLADIIELLLDQETGAAFLQEFRNGRIGGVAAVGIPEGIVDIDISVTRQLLGEAVVIGGLFGMEAEVLEQDHLSGLQRVDRLLDLGTDAVLDKPDFLPQEPRKTFRHGRKAHIGDDLSLRPAQMRHHDDNGAFIQCIIQRWQHRPDPGVIGDVQTTVHRNVEVEAEQNLFPLDVDAVDEFHGSSLPFFRKKVMMRLYLLKTLPYQWVIHQETDATSGISRAFSITQRIR